MKLNESEPVFPEILTFINSINQAIKQACRKVNSTDIFLKRKYYISIAIVQGLASLNFIDKDLDARSQSQMLDEAIDSLIDSLK